MSFVQQLSRAQRLAGFAGALAAVASLVGFIPGVYRDSHALVVQSHGQDVATLVVVLPVLLVGLIASARGSVRGRVVVLGALGYLLYTYAVYAFIGLLAPATILHIAIVGLAAWALVATIATRDELPEVAVAAAIGGGLRRRTSAAYLLVIAGLFAFAWRGQILGTALSGVRPQQLVDAGWPTSPMFTLDLAFVLPLCALAGYRLLRRRAGGSRLAGPLLVFAPPLSVGVLSIGSFAALDGQTLSEFDLVLSVVFVLVAVSGATLAGRALLPTRGEDSSGQPLGTSVAGNG